MVKIAAIDCGSNSTRLLIADVSSGTLSPLYKTHQVTKTSEGVEADNNISQDAKNRLIKTLRGYLKKIKYRECGPNYYYRHSCVSGC